MPAKRSDGLDRITAPVAQLAAAEFEYRAAKSIRKSECATEAARESAA